MDTHQLMYNKEENTLRTHRERYLLKTYILQYLSGIYQVYTSHCASAAHGLARLVAQPPLAASDLDALRIRSAFSGGQTRADFFKSLRESAKSASGALFADFFRRFADFVQTFFDVLQTFADFCRLVNHLHADFLQTLCPGDYF